MRVALSLALLAGCQSLGGGGGPTPLTEIPPLPTQFGCSDVWMYAVSDDGAASVRFSTPGPVEAAYNGTPSQSWSADDPALDLAFEQGQQLQDEGCTDLIEYEDGEPVVQVDLSWAPVSGSVSLDVTPTGTTFNECDSPADAVLTLDGVVFELTSGEQLTLDHLEVDAAVGYCPG